MTSASAQPDCRIWRIRGQTLDLTDRALVMGILNLTPDSFSDGGTFLSEEHALTHARQMVDEGAAIIDIGGESTRPGSEPVDAIEEMSRVLPIVEAIASELDVIISIDTTKARVAEAAYNAGAHIINDISGGTRDPDMLDLWARLDAGLVIMHSQGTPTTMQDSPTYTDVTSEVAAFFYERLRKITAHGIPPERLVFDPGIGFGKTLEHNLELLKNLDTLEIADRPLLLGVSRKSFIGQVLGDDDITLRDWPTVALTAHSRRGPTRIIRVHDVLPNAQALTMTEAILSPQ